MKKLSIVVVVIIGASTPVCAESLYLNAAQYEDASEPSRTYRSAPAVAPLPTYTTATVTAGESDLNAPTATFSTSTSATAVGHGSGHHGGCRAGGCQHGSLDDYPGGCCESGGACCAALWANYCEQKKPCWTPESPRRHSGHGFAIPTFGLFPCDALTSLHRKPAPCDDTCDDTCDSQVSTLAYPQDRSKSVQPDEADGISPSDLPVQSPATSTDAEAPSASEPIQPIPPPEGAMKNRFGLPFSWKLPGRAKSNPFSKSAPTARYRTPLSR